jgi:benzylsuccinate CoA-transferase BbsE subunit
VAGNGLGGAHGGSYAGPLAGLRVLEVAGPLGEYCGKLFADLGADVILVEPPGGASSRREGPFVDQVPGIERSLTFSYLHTSKRGITLDLDSVAGQQLFRRLAAQAGLVVESEPAGAMQARGLGYEALKAEQPSLVYTSITPFGSEGPYVDYEATDLVLLAMGGLLYLGGYGDGEPIRAHGNQALLAAGQFAAIGSLLAVLEAEQSGQGQFVDVSAQECVVMAHETAIQFYDLEKVVRRRTGEDQRQAGLGVYPCKDGHIYLLVGGLARFWDELVNWLEGEGVAGAEELRDPKWQTLEFAQSEEGKARFLEIFRPFTMRHTKAELYEAGKQQRLPLCPVNTPADLASSPQLQARNYLTIVQSDGLGRALEMPGAPYQLSATPWRVQRPAPGLGEHNSEIFAEVQVTADDLARLSAAGVI